MKKIILTALLAVFVMAGFANNNTPLKPNVKEVKIEKNLKIELKKENKSDEKQVPIIKNYEKPAEVCFEFPMCGFSGWACGETMNEAVDNAVFAYIWHCLRT